LVGVTYFPVLFFRPSLPYVLVLALCEYRASDDVDQRDSDEKDEHDERYVRVSPKISAPYLAARTQRIFTHFNLVTKYAGLNFKCWLFGVYVWRDVSR